MTPADPLRPDSHSEHDEFHLFPNAFLEHKPVWAGLYESVLEAFFPIKLPPLELTSTPIPVPDRMAVKTNPWAVGSSTLVNGGILAVVLCLGVGAVLHPPPKPVSGAHIDLSDLQIFAPPRAQASHGGGGGGANELTDPIVGRLPDRAPTPLLAPQVTTIENPRLAINPAMAVPPDIRLPDNPTLPDLGVHTSANVTLASGGQGRNGIGMGMRGGDGSGDGPGAGPGWDGGAGTGVYTPGGGISAPVPLTSPEAEFSDEARRSKFQGICMVTVIVDAQGYPQNPHVIQPLGMGLDQKALEAVSRYRFKPSLKDGKPVPVRITVAVNFRLY